MELFRLEHKKLWRKTSTRICVLLCVFYCVVFGSFLTFQWIAYGSTKENYSGNNFDGYENIRNCQDYSRKYEVLTDETLQEWIRDFKSLYAQLREERKTQGAENQETVHKVNNSDLYTVNGWLKTLYPELERADMLGVTVMSDYVDTEKLTGLYERREKAVDTFLEINNQTGAERDYLLRINEKVKEPFSWGWTEGWSNLLGSAISELGSTLAVFFAIVLSALFAGEWHDNTSPLLLTTKNGWKKLAMAKILTGFSFTLELFTMVAVGMIAVQLVYFGTEGWDMPIQMIKMIAIAPMNMLQAEIYEYVYFLLGSVGLALLVMFFSAVARNNFIALVSGLAIVYLPMALTGYMPMQVQRVFDLIPLVGSPSDIFRTNVFHMFGQIIWSPYLLITIPVILGCAFIPFTVRRWAGRLKR